MIQEFKEFYMGTRGDKSLNYTAKADKMLSAVDIYEGSEREELMSDAMQYLIWDNEYDRVIEYCSKNLDRLTIDQYISQMYRNWFLALENSGRMDEAIALRSAKMEKYDEGGISNDVAEAYERLGDIDNALIYYDKYLIEEEGYLDTEDMEKIAKFYDAKGDYDNAARYLSIAAVNECRESAYLWQNTGRALAMTGKLDEAMKYFEVALKLNPKSENTQYCMGQVYQERGDQYRALHHYTEALKINPNNPMVYNNLGALAFDEDGDIKGAIEKIEAALEMNPDAPLKLTMHINLARLYHKISDYDNHNRHKKEIFKAAGFGSTEEDLNEEEEG